MHSCVYVLINGPIQDTTTLVDEAMAPFDEARPVPPYMIHVNRGGTRAMAENYKIDEKNLAALKPKLQEWFGRPGGIDELGLYLISNENPIGRWDWYEIGGRWNGYLHGRTKRASRRSFATLELNSMPVAQFLRSKQLSKRLPCAVVTPAGEWFTRRVDVDVSYGWFSWELSSTEWAKRVRRVLRAFPNHRIVCVDAHH